MRIRKIPSVYSEDQLSQYLERIGWKGSRPEPTLACLQRLQRRHLCSIPFANTFIVYEETPPDIDAQELFERLVVRRGGHFCFGQNTLFREMLRAIGFRCYSVVGRVNANYTNDEAPRFGPTSHLATLVSFNEDPKEPDEGHLYLTDVGFGAGCLIAPIPLQMHAEIKGALNEYHRISSIHHPDSSLEEQDPANETVFPPPPPLQQNYCLQLQARQPDGSPLHKWRVAYVFSSKEAYADDISYLHYGVCRLTKLFTENITLSKHIEHSEDEPLGKITLFNTSFKIRSRAGAEEEVTKLSSEKERIQALQDKFGLGNLPSEAESIIERRGKALT